jgi:hypothetical protein
MFIDVVLLMVGATTGFGLVLEVCTGRAGPGFRHGKNGPGRRHNGPGRAGPDPQRTIDKPNDIPKKTHIYLKIRIFRISTASSNPTPRLS